MGMTYLVMMTMMMDTIQMVQEKTLMTTISEIVGTTDIIMNNVMKKHFNNMRRVFPNLLS